MPRIQKIAGYPVVDAKKPLEVHVTRGDVKQGSIKNAKTCAAAVAIKRQISCQAARVHVSRTYVLAGKSWIRYATPLALNKEIISFDRGGRFEPGDYKLRPVQPSHLAENRTESRKANKTKRKSHSNKGLRKPHITTGIRAPASK